MAAPDPLRRALLLQRRADQETVRILKEALADIDRNLRDLERRGGIGAKVRRVQLQAARMQIHGSLAGAWKRLGDLARAEAAEAAKQASRAAAKYDEEFLRRLGLNTAQRAAYQAGLEEAAKRDVEDALNRRIGNKHSLSARVYDSNLLANRAVDRKIESALARGLTNREFAKEMRSFIRPDTPGGTSYAAKRLARTEINNAYHRSQIASAQHKPWVIGVRWMLSSSHPKIDTCDALAGGNSAGMQPGVYKPDDVPEKPHPQCMCFTEPVTLSPAEFEKRMKAGDFDDWMKNNIPTAEPPSTVAKTAAKKASTSKAPKPTTKPVSKAAQKKATAAQRKTDRIAANKAKPMSQRKILGDPAAQARRAGIKSSTKMNWNSLSKAEKAKARQTIIDTATKGSMHIRMSQKALDTALKSGRIKSMHEIAEAAGRRGADYVKTRTAYEDSIMGLDGISAADRPIYGYVGDIEGASGYGDYVVTLDEGVRGDITVSAGDSLNGMLDVRRPAEIAGLSEADLLGMIGHDEVRSIPEGVFKSYMEMQVPHVTNKKIARITVPSDAPPELVARLKKLGYKVDVQLTEEDAAMELIKRRFGK